MTAMMKPAFSTVGCPEWTLPQVAERAQAGGFESVELRTFGEASNRFACDPALTSGDKVRRIFGERGVEVSSLATGVGFEEPVRPPVIGWAICDTERHVRAGRSAVGLAVAIEAPLVRVFGFDIPPREARKSAIGRIAKRLAMVLDHANNTGTRIVLENAGGFSRAAEVMELLDVVGHPLLGISYNIAVGHAAGDEVDAALDTIGDRLLLARLKSVDADGQPVLPGSGVTPCEQFVRSLAMRGFTGPLVFEWDRAWVPTLPTLEQVMPEMSSRIWGWLGAKPAGAGLGADGAPRLKAVAGARR